MFSQGTYEAAAQWFLSMMMRQYIIGYLGRPDAGGTFAFFVPGDPGKVYVRVWQGEVVALDKCVNTVTPLEPNLRVFMHRINGVLRVAFSDPVSAASLFQNNAGAAGVPPHIALDDSSLVTGNRIADLNVHAPDPSYAGLNLCIEAGKTAYSYLLRRSDYDVSAYLSPSSGMRHWVLCYVDTDGTVKFSTTGSVETATPATDMLLDNGGNTAIAALESLTISNGWQPLAGIVLDNGQTEVTSNTRIVDWRNHSAVEGGTGGGSPLTTKGDLFGFDTADARIPVGTDGQTLVADSAQALGLKWQFGAPGSVSQQYVGYNTIGGSSLAMVTGTVYYKKITLSSPGQLTDISAYVLETSVANVSNVGCYLVSDNAGVPGDIIAEGTMYSSPPSLNMASGNARWLSMGCPIWLPAGSYWMAVQKQGANGVLNLYYDAVATDYEQTNTGSWISDGVANTGASGAPALGSNKYSIRGSVIS